VFALGSGEPLLCIVIVVLPLAAGLFASPDN
jgi:hypothetical protein